MTNFLLTQKQNIKKKQSQQTRIPSDRKKWIKITLVIIYNNIMKLDQFCSQYLFYFN